MGKYFTEAERYKLETLLKTKMTKQKIADHLGKSLSTIKREIKRGTVTLQNHLLIERDVYCADTAQNRYEEMKKRKGPKSKLLNDPDMVQFLKKKIVHDKYSPYAAMIALEKQYQRHFSFCLKTLYNAINKGVLKGISSRHLHLKKVTKKKKEEPKKHKRSIKPERTNIDERPPIINDRLEMNHWEMDCVVSGRSCKGSDALLVITERISDLSIVRKLKTKTQNEVHRVLNELEVLFKAKFPDVFRSITMDNGVEFLDYEAIENSTLKDGKRTVTYYCHPYSAFERGANENVNCLVRYHLPKGCDISNFTDDFIQDVEDWINDYPRKKFGGLSSNEVYANLVDAFNP